MSPGQQTDIKFAACWVFSYFPSQTFETREKRDFTLTCLYSQKANEQIHVEQVYFLTSARNGWFCSASRLLEITGQESVEHHSNVVALPSLHYLSSGNSKRRYQTEVMRSKLYGGRQLKS